MHRFFCETRQQIDRFPTIRAFANGGADMEIYKQNLDTDSIVAYVQSLMRTRAQHLTAAQTLEYRVNDTVQARPPSATDHGTAPPPPQSPPSPRSLPPGLPFSILPSFSSPAPRPLFSRGNARGVRADGAPSASRIGAPSASWERRRFHTSTQGARARRPNGGRAEAERSAIR